MKVLTSGFYSLILYVINPNEKLKDFNEWSISFYHIVDLPHMASIFMDDTNECAFNELIDTLFKVETKMNRFSVEGRVITDARW